MSALASTRPPNRSFPNSTASASTGTSARRCRSSKPRRPGVVLSGPCNGSVSHLEVDNLGEFSAGLVCFNGGVVERVRSRVSGPRSLALGALSGCVVRDSLLLAEGAELASRIFGEAFENGLVGTVSNVTAIGEGPWRDRDHVQLRHRPGRDLHARHPKHDRRRRGGRPPGDQIEYRHRGRRSSLTPTSTARNRNSPAKLTDAGGNQAAAPIFANPGAGDYREAAGSPTIDAGRWSIYWAPSRLDGFSRVIGPAPDIGAYEFLPKAPPPVAGRLESLSVAPRSFQPAESGRGDCECFEERQKSAPRNRGELSVERLNHRRVQGRAQVGGPQGQREVREERPAPIAAANHARSSKRSKDRSAISVRQARTASPSPAASGQGAETGCLPPRPARPRRAACRSAFRDRQVDG